MQQEQPALSLLSCQSRDGSRVGECVQPHRCYREDSLTAEEIVNLDR